MIFRFPAPHVGYNPLGVTSVTASRTIPSGLTGIITHSEPAAGEELSLSGDSSTLSTLNGQLFTMEFKLTNSQNQSRTYSMTVEFVSGPMSISFNNIVLDSSS